MKKVEIEGHEVESICNFNKRYLCSLSKEHLSKLKDWRNSQMDVLRQFEPLTDYDQEKWFQQISEDDTQVIFSIMVPDEQNNLILIGYCGITNIDFKNRRGEISFLVSPARAQDERLYREDFLSVLNMICKYGFNEINLNKLFTETFAFREYHIKILEEFGFHSDGTLREHQFTNGQYHDSLIHSILCDEWHQ
ncbi:MAG: GNAT family protein [Thermotogota bacterium]|nr:GNAT family protein [Thermotogota bacterium]